MKPRRRASTRSFPPERANRLYSAAGRAGRAGRAGERQRSDLSVGSGRQLRPADSCSRPCPSVRKHTQPASRPAPSAPPPTARPYPLPVPVPPPAPRLGAAADGDHNALAAAQQALAGAAGDVAHAVQQEVLAQQRRSEVDGLWAGAGDSGWWCVWRGGLGCARRGDSRLAECRAGRASEEAPAPHQGEHPSVDAREEALEADGLGAHGEPAGEGQHAMWVAAEDVCGRSSRGSASAPSIVSNAAGPYELESIGAFCMAHRACPAAAPPSCVGAPGSRTPPRATCPSVAAARAMSRCARRGHPRCGCK